MKLNAEAKDRLRQAGITQADWIRYWGDGTSWRGDACGCPDDRCMDGFHHYPNEECGCLAAWISDFQRDLK